MKSKQKALDMELRHLRYFIAVAEALNFSRPAERLHVSQPPLSRQVQDLGAELKVKLLDRNRQRVQLTRVGQAVLARVNKGPGAGLLKKGGLRKVTKNGLTEN